MQSSWPLSLPRSLSSLMPSASSLSFLAMDIFRASSASFRSSSATEATDA
jgi:hypothetical protein